MPTLEEFVQGTLTANNLPGDVSEIIAKIYEIAKERKASFGSMQIAAISDEEVREMVINNAELSAKIAEEKEKKARAEAEKRAQEEQLKQIQKMEEKKTKALEKERKVAGGEQISLFG